MSQLSILANGAFLSTIVVYVKFRNLDMYRSSIVTRVNNSMST